MSLPACGTRTNSPPEREIAMEPARRMEMIGSHLSASAGAMAGARDSPDDIVIVDAIRTPITRARKVRFAGDYAGCCLSCWLPHSIARCCRGTDLAPPPDASSVDCVAARFCLVASAAPAGKTPLFRTPSSQLQLQDTCTPPLLRMEVHTCTAPVCTHGNTIPQLCV